MTGKTRSLILSFLFLSAEAVASGDSQDSFCEDYDWGKVEALVEPHLDEASYTTLVMQGLSSEYNTSVAAYQAMDPQLPEEIYNILSRIVKLNCP